MPASVERRLVPVAGGVVHATLTGAGPPVVLLHQTPRSWDEYRDVLPLLGQRRAVVALDTPGFGDSTPLDDRPTVEGWAATLLSALATLGIARAAVVGHHTGGYVAAEMAAAAPERVSALVLSSVVVQTREERLAQAEERAVVDEVPSRADGGHLLELWQLRAPFYPVGSELLDRFMIDCLRAGSLAGEGHRVVARYALEDRLGLIGCPTLLIGATADPHAFPFLGALQAALPDAETTIIEDGMVPLPDQLPGAFAAAVERFLDLHGA